MGVIVGPALGPVLGGWITDNFTWRWAFFINLPVGIAAATLIWIYLRNPIGAAARSKLDWIGLGAAGDRARRDAVRARSGAAIRLVRRSRTFGFFTALAVVGLGGFVWWTLRSAIPVVDLHVLRLAASRGGQRCSARCWG